MGWLHSRQKGGDAPRLHYIGQEKAAESFPDIGGLKYLLRLFLELGLCDGDKPISWQEIYAWQRLTFTPLELWEAKMLKNLSELYVQSYKQNNDTHNPSPMDAKKAAGAKLDSQLKSALRRLGSQAANG